MKIAIIGTRGIPNHYGGFEQCAEYLATGLVSKGYEVAVYNSHNHPYQQKELNGVEIRHCYDPEYKMGTIGQFFYDLNCIRDARKRNFDIILQLGYSSSSVWGWLLPRTSIITTNMDGLEWKRTKYSKKVQMFLRYAEKLAVKYSDHLIADSVEIQRYLTEKYNKKPVFIAYGAELVEETDLSILSRYNVEPGQYDMLVARMEPENSIETILDGVVKANVNRKFLVVGALKNSFSAYLQEKFAGCSSIIFTGEIYNINILNNLRYYSNAYFHGHQVGGTNPSLLEAMASNGLICAHDNQFNRTVTEHDAFYFSNPDEVAAILQTTIKASGAYDHMIHGNRERIRTYYNRENIVNMYAEHFEQLMQEHVATHHVAERPAPVGLTLNTINN